MPWDSWDHWGIWWLLVLSRRSEMASFTCLESSYGWLEGRVAPACSPSLHALPCRFPIRIGWGKTHSALWDTNPEAFWIAGVKYRASHISSVLFFSGCKQLTLPRFKRRPELPSEIWGSLFSLLATDVLKVCGLSQQHCSVSTSCHFMHLRFFFYSFFKEECDKKQKGKHLRWRSCYSNRHGSSAIWPWGF